MQNIIAIYGPTCTLKTEVAQELSVITGFKVANRGEWAVTWAKYTGKPTPHALADEFHRELDEETRRMAQRDEELMVFESTFMDAVLKGVPNVYWVRLRSSDEVRQKRWTQRKEEAGGRTRQLGESVAARDRDDAALRQRLYGGIDGGVKPVHDIDTSSRTAVEVALQVWEAFEAKSGIQVVTHKPVMDKAAARGISPGPTKGKVSRYTAKQPPFGGYITDERSGKDIYVHKSALGELPNLEPGQEVAFDIVADSFGGFKAVKVRAPA
ncbi:MAG TPA: cold shock domain-containing protein [Usitatibacter sp.]|nr:cold shock domain-containing protein [Usitatibacter sp.]